MCNLDVERATEMVVEGVLAVALGDVDADLEPDDRAGDQDDDQDLSEAA